MHAKPQRSEASGARPGQASKRSIPDPPDPDNLPIDYLDSGWDSSRPSPSVPHSLRPQHSTSRRSARS
jgi:hypothetical protein